MSLYRSGMNMRQVAEELGVSNSCISKFMKEYNIKTQKIHRGRSNKTGN